MAQGWRICPDAKSVLCTSGPESNGMTVPGLYGGPYPIGPRAHIIADNVRIPRAGGTRKASTRGGRLDTASKQNVLRQAEEQNVKFIRLWFTDILGTLKSFAITIGELEDALDDGMGFDGSSITGYQDIEESDMIASLDAATALRRDTILALEQLDIDVEYSHHEVGISQHEIDLRFDGALEMADKVMTYKTVVKEIATRHGVYATFMPKPLRDENGSGMHTHQSLFTNGKNAFFDADNEYYLSDEAKQFIAGQLRHAREISIIFAQFVNSYKRLVLGYEAPVYIAWSRRNRSALVRVPLYHPGKEQATRAELRCPDPSANIYLCFAALLHAGLEGIEKGYELPEPMERNLYHLSHEEREKMGITSLPSDLGEAIREAENSELLQKALGEHVFTRLLNVKREEWEDYRVQVTPYEIQKYLPIL